MIDPSIPLRVQTHDFSGRQGRLDAFRMADLLDQKHVRDLQTQQLEQQIADKNALREGLKNSINEDGTLNTDAIQNAYIQAGDPLTGYSFTSQHAANQLKTKESMLDFEIKKMDTQARLLGSATDPVSWQAAYQRAASIFGPEEMRGVPQEYPGPDGVRSMLEQTLTAKDRLTAMRDQEKFAETQRHNKATESIAQQKVNNAAAKNDSDKFKSSDANVFRGVAAEFFGGTYDPTTGRFSGLTKDLAGKATDLAARASRIYVDAGGQLTHNEAAQQAANELKSGSGNPNPAGGDTPPTAAEYLDSLFGG